MRNILAKVSSLVKPSRKLLTIASGLVVLGLIGYGGYVWVSENIVKNWDLIQFALTNPNELRDFKLIYQEKHAKTTALLIESLKVP